MRSCRLRAVFFLLTVFMLVTNISIICIGFGDKEIMPPPPPTIRHDSTLANWNALKVQAPRSKDEIRIQSDNEAISISESVSCHFPEYGTKEFERECGWLSARSSNHKYNSCTLFAKLYAKGNEGVSDWSSRVVETHQLAVQGNCHLLVDYGVSGVDLRQVFQVAGSENWTVPNNYDCDREPTCFQARGKYHIQKQLAEMTNATETEILTTPLYRMIYRRNPFADTIHRGRKPAGQELREKWHDFLLETSFACSFTSLFKLTPTASLYEPTLFTDILPKLHQEDGLVICLYIRTGRTDTLAKDEEKNTQNTDKNFTLYEDTANPTLSCTQRLEQEYLSNNTKYTKTVWLLITDAPHLKDYISSKYTTPSRTVLTTASRGIHSRPARTPSMNDVAEALIDWYLIGESVFVVSMGSVSYGETGALRTARPIYNGYKCEQMTMNK